MNLSEFVEKRRPAWQELQALLERAERDEVGALPHERARRLVDLYRRASADLVQARTYGAGASVTSYLEALVARGYALLYQAAPLRAWDAWRAFFREGFPRAVRRERQAFALAAAALVLGLLFGALTTAFDPQAARLFVPADHQSLRPSERVAHDERAQAEHGGVLSAGEHAAFSSFLFTHNIGVSIVCFAIGVAWGLPTLLLLAWHGVFLAALAVEYARDGQALFFCAWILPHGIVELTCMLLAGTAGLMLGRGVLWPRGLPRGARVRQEARAALDVLGGSAALLVVAGVVEGTLSQIHEPTLPYALKIGFALALGALTHAYLWLLPLPAADAPAHNAPRDLRSR